MSTEYTNFTKEDLSRAELDSLRALYELKSSMKSTGKEMNGFGAKTESLMQWYDPIYGSPQNSATTAYTASQTVDAANAELQQKWEAGKQSIKDTQKKYDEEERKLNAVLDAKVSKGFPLSPQSSEWRKGYQSKLQQASGFASGSGAKK